MLDLGPMSHYLGMEVDVTDVLVTMPQSTYLKKALARFQMEDCEFKSMPVEPGFPVSWLPFDDRPVRMRRSGTN